MAPGQPGQEEGRLCAPSLPPRTDGRSCGRRTAVSVGTAGVCDLLAQGAFILQGKPWNPCPNVEGFLLAVKERDPLSTQAPEAALAFQPQSLNSLRKVPLPLDSEVFFSIPSLRPPPLQILSGSSKPCISEPDVP